MNLIELENISKTYHVNGAGTRVEALRGVNLKIQRGEFIALMGPSGSGKSTLMSILGCLDEPTEGNYFFGRKNISMLSENEISGIRCQKIGFVFQSFHLIPRVSALENVKVPLIYSSFYAGNGAKTLSENEIQEMAVNALEKVGLKMRARHDPSQLSGGEKQRVAIARALINKPSLILADEPTGNLDTATSMEIMEIFQYINKRGITVVLVTHEEGIARYAQRLVNIKDGKIEGRDVRF